MIGVVETAAATVSVLAPFLPHLIAAGKAGGKKLVETIAEKGGEAVWGKAQALWGKIKNKLGDAADVQGAATVVATNPDNENFKKVLAEALSIHLEKDPELVKELVELLGGEKAIQEVLADSGSWVEDITQDLEGAGTQTVKATNNSVIRGIKQSIKK